MKNFEEIFRHLVPGKYYGELVSIFQGAGVEKKDIRSYVAGDDTKAINWKTSAKRDELFVNVFQQEKDASLKLFFDINVNWKSGVSTSNSDLIIQYFTDIVVYCLTYNVNVECFSTINGEIVASYLGKDKIKAYAYLCTLRDSIANYSQRSYSSHVSNFLHHVSKDMQRSGIVVFSDFLDVDDMTVQTLKKLRKDNQVYLFRLPVGESHGSNYSGRSTKSLGLNIINYISM